MYQVRLISVKGFIYGFKLIVSLINVVLVG